MQFNFVLAVTLAVNPSVPLYVIGRTERDVKVMEGRTVLLKVKPFADTGGRSDNNFVYALIK